MSTSATSGQVPPLHPWDAREIDSTATRGRPRRPQGEVEVGGKRDADPDRDAPDPKVPLGRHAPAQAADRLAVLLGAAASTGDEEPGPWITETNLSPPAKPDSVEVMKIVVAALKGGVGKTTTCLYLAALAAAGGRDVSLVDADPQASAADWLESSGDPALEAVELVEAPTERLLTKALAAVEEDEIAIVDPPPGNERMIAVALQAADVVVIPTRVGGVEWPRVDVVRSMVPRRTPYGLVVCSARTFTRDYDETLRYWIDQGVAVWGTIPERVAIAAGPDRGLSAEGIEVYRPLWRRILRASRD